MKKKASKLNKVTLFSVNPATKAPYLEIDEARRMIRTHVNYKIPHLLIKNSMEDLEQMFLIKACSSTYKPSKCAPKTWMTTILITRGVQQHNFDNAKGRYLGGVPDEFKNSEGELDYYSMNVADHVTPLDYMLAQEIVDDFNEEMAIREGLGKEPRQAPIGYRVSKKISGAEHKEIKSKKCADCGARKLKAMFSKNISTNDGYTTVCKVCINNAMKIARAQKKRRQSRDKSSN